MNLSCAALPLGDTNVFGLCFPLQVRLPSEQIGSCLGFNMPIVNSIGHKEEEHGRLQAVCVPGMAT